MNIKPIRCFHPSLNSLGIIPPSQGKLVKLWENCMNTSVCEYQCNDLHIHNKRKQMGLLLQRMCWIIGLKSKLSLTNKLLIYKIILKPIWTYGLPLWGTASQSNIEILQRLQNRILRMATNAPRYVPNRATNAPRYVPNRATNAPRYVPNHALNTDLQMPTIREEITRLSSNYKAKIEVHPNKLTTSLFEKQGPGRLRRHSPIDLPTRFIT